MNWLAFGVLAWLLLGLEVGLRDALRLGTTSVAPSFVVPLAVYVALSTSPRLATWAAVVLGIGLDLTWLLPRTDGPQAHLIGPYALGLVLAVQLVLALRGLVIRTHFFTHAALGIVGAAVVHIVVVGMLAAREIAGDPIAFNGIDQLRTRMLAAVFTGVLAFFLSFVLVRLDPVMGFHLDRSGRYLR
ncbi:MAG: hypothetical protein AAF235_07975 [Planctomycetota bacterium]